jgi:hypothetical protein
MEEDLWIYAAALTSGYLSLSDLIAWSELRVLRFQSPPRWLLDLCSSKTQNEALGTLLDVCYRCKEAVRQDCPAHDTHDNLHLGFLFLRFERGDLTLAELLKMSGHYADSSGCDIECEVFYVMLNEIDGLGPTISSDEPLEKRVASLFRDKAALARHYAEKLPQVKSVN